MQCWRVTLNLVFVVHSRCACTSGTCLYTCMAHRGKPDKKNKCFLIILLEIHTKAVHGLERIINILNYL